MTPNQPTLTISPLPSLSLPVATPPLPRLPLPLQRIRHGLGPGGINASAVVYGGSKVCLSAKTAKTVFFLPRPEPVVVYDDLTAIYKWRRPISTSLPYRGVSGYDQDALDSWSGRAQHRIAEEAVPAPMGVGRVPGRKREDSLCCESPPLSPCLILPPHRLLTSLSFVFPRGTGVIHPRLRRSRSSWCRRTPLRRIVEIELTAHNSRRSWFALAFVPCVLLARAH